MGSDTTTYGKQERLERDWILFNKRNAVIEHRKMWKWIAHAIAVDKENMSEEICHYKNDYLTKMISLNEDLKKEVKTEEEKQFCDENISYYRQTIEDNDCFCCMFMFKYIHHAPQFEILSDRSHKECKYICPVVWECIRLGGKIEQNVRCYESYWGNIESKAFHKQWKKML